MPLRPCLLLLKSSCLGLVKLVKWGMSRASGYPDGQADLWAEVTWVFLSALVAGSQVYHLDPSQFLPDASSARKGGYLSIRRGLRHVRIRLSRYRLQRMEEGHGPA
jgi:hypothetical protein